MAKQSAFPDGVWEWRVNVSMSIWLSRDEAFILAFKKDWWLWLKIPLWLFLAWTFFLPQLYKICVLLIVSIVCAFVFPCPIGGNITNFHLALMLFAAILICFIVLWYAIYVIAFLCKPGWNNKLIAISGAIIFPFILIALAFIVGTGFTLLGIPQEEIWAYVDKWIPFKSWKS